MPSSLRARPRTPGAAGRHRPWRAAVTAALTAALTSTAPLALPGTGHARSASASAPASASASGGSAGAGAFEQQVLFRASQDPGYACFRIPAVVRTTKGTLLAFAEGRVNDCGDAGDTDLVLKRST